MKAVGYTESLPIDDPKSLQDVELPQPAATGRDILVRVRAIGVNPVDFKVRQRAAAEPGETKVLGWDAVGEVVATGEAVSLFEPGDQVYYAGDVTRQGSNAEYQIVDERIVGRKPASLNDAEAAALPLTTITAWEMLFDHLGLERQSPEEISPTDDVILVVGAAGGVGSILIQLAKKLTGATVVATASRPESRQWVESLGADFVVNHREPLLPQIERLVSEGKIAPITHVASLNATDQYFDDYVAALRPFGRIAMIDDPASLDVMKIKPKSLSLHIEFMFARSMHNADDMKVQHDLLETVASLVDQGHIRTTAGKNLGIINADNLRVAHSELESGTAVGKIVLEGFE
ncbi:zinc-binding alcohol dehydrogenase family protein [Marinobacter sp.]|uniref:zinc-binding alcohol dehydrogenase family protein n=1 Tax=Marinobacter sp. TaxID=50741 RepID=UPI000C5A736D|nr:zinc-binding alcohol dehydrogenase family protein [Marinobacter sp.]MBE94846.1 NADPH:quinone reductase [Marinobacter sp.]|tara:strand:+ start:814 stop:1854 length:1041 start_codon:yes stop_codon:yes gene_type:complete